MKRRARPADPTCKALVKWLKLNGLHLGVLTGTDWKALFAAVHIVELYAYGRSESAVLAFRLVVLEMQPSTRYFAFHAIAHVMEWNTRYQLWIAAELPDEDIVHAPLCEGEPTRRALSGGREP